MVHLASSSVRAPERADGGAPRLVSPQGLEQRLLACIDRHGFHPTSFQILKPGCEYWFGPEHGGVPTVVAYVRAGKDRVVVGQPLAPPHRLGEVAAEFVADGVAQGEATMFASADGALIDQLSERADGPRPDVVPIGQQPCWDPARYGLAGRDRRTLRAQVRRAGRHGVTVEPLSAGQLHRDPKLAADLHRVLQGWKASRRLPVLGFMVRPVPFLMPEQRRYFLATHDGRTVAFLAAAPIPGRGGWLFEDVVRVPGAPNGTVELLIHTALQDARDRGERYVSLGLAPLAQTPTGAGPHRLLRAGMRWGYRHFGTLYNFHGLYRFKDRFCPDRWEPQYLIRTPGTIGVASLARLAKAFTDRWPPALLALALRRVAVAAAV